MLGVELVNLCVHFNAYVGAYPLFLSNFYFYLARRRVVVAILDLHVILEWYEHRSIIFWIKEGLYN